MQAMPASTETRLPRPIQRQLANLEDRRKAQETASAETQPTPETPPVDQVTAPPAPPNTPDTLVSLPEDPRENDPAYWKQLYLTTQGRLTALREQVKATAGEHARQVSEMQEQVRALQASAPSAPPDPAQFLSPEQVEMLGTEEAQAITAAAMKAAQQAVDAAIKPLREERKAERTQAVEEVKSQFVQKLLEQVPDFEAIDKTDGWYDWLADDHETAGVPRQVLLDQYVRKGDVGKTAALFKAYKATLAPAARPPIAPNGSGSNGGGQPLPAAGTGHLGLTAVEIKDYYKRASLGKVKEAERLQFEARLKLPRR